LRERAAQKPRRHERRVHATTEVGDHGIVVQKAATAQDLGGVLVAGFQSIRDNLSVDILMVAQKHIQKANFRELIKRLKPTLAEYKESLDLMEKVQNA
jgi:hypothetical protein